MRSKRGFTLIELLVVIAIIGVLASIVLAALNTARNKGNDAAIKGNLASIRVQTALYYDNNSNSYGTPTVAAAATCTNNALMFYTDTSMRNAINGLIGLGATPTCAIGVSGATWSVSAPLKTKSNASWCVSDSGYAGYGTSTEAAVSNPATC